LPKKINNNQKHNIMKKIIYILLAILMLTVIYSLITEPLTTDNFLAGMSLMCIAGTSLLLLNKQNS